ncbi:kinase-like domain-containing protein [Phycomyces nitens]|nr:kinase-like domain-containing protein [Phycomyces nitens]
MVLAEVIEFCQERGLPTEGTKSELISNIMFWKQNTSPIPAPSTPKLICSVLPETLPLTVREEKLELNSREFTALFLDDNASGFDIPYKDLIIGDKLGSGGFKDCYRAEVKHEVNVLKQLRHENVIKFIGVCTNPRHLSIITEICEKGDLFDVIRKYKKPSFSQQVMYMYDIALGVSYLHTRR